MKTKQEQIKAMTGIIAETLQDKRVENGATFVSYLPSLLGSADKEKEVAEVLMQAGYGDVSEYKAEIEQLNKKLAKQTRIARDANAKCNGTERYLRPFQYKANRLETKCNDLKKLSDWQREEIKILKAEVNKGCDDCETVKQAKIDVLKELKKRARTSYVLDDFILGSVVFSKDIDELIKEVEEQ